MSLQTLSVAEEQLLSRIKGSDVPFLGLLRDFLSPAIQTTIELLTLAQPTVEQYREYLWRHPALFSVNLTAHVMEGMGRDGHFDLYPHVERAIGTDVPLTQSERESLWTAFRKAIQSLGFEAGSGNDLLRGGTGNDILYGGIGKDIFRLDTALGTSTTPNIDQIKDFSVLDDTIQLENAIFTRFGTTTIGTINAAYFKANTTGLAADSNDYIIYETDTGKLFYDSNGNAAGGSVQIALLGINLALTSADFVLI